MNFQPTWLYIKQHNITGLKYFGKTIRDVDAYSGSGVYWMRHIVSEETKKKMSISAKERCARRRVS